MKVGELMKHLEEFDPELMVVYAIDDEGNSFRPVHFAPSAGNYSDGEWITEGEMEHDYNDVPEYEINAVCVN